MSLSPLCGTLPLRGFSPLRGSALSQPSVGLLKFVSLAGIGHGAGGQNSLWHKLEILRLSTVSRVVGSEASLHRSFSQGFPLEFLSCSPWLQFTSFRTQDFATTKAMVLDLALTETQSTSSMSFSCSIGRSTDNRWIPPWIVVPPKARTLWSVTPVYEALANYTTLFSLYATFMFLTFLQGFLCQFSLNNLCVYAVNLPSRLSKPIRVSQGLITVFLSPYQLCLSFVLDPRVVITLLGGSVMLHIPVSHVKAMDRDAPPPPPAPNLWVNTFSGPQNTWHPAPVVHTDLLGPVLLWFKSSGFQPPWNQSTSCIVIMMFTSIFRWLSMVKCEACCLNLKNLPVETVARKPIGVVFDGTNAQFHHCDALVAECLLSRLGSLHINRRGWEFVSINEKRSSAWETILIKMFNWKQIGKWLYPVLGSCYVTEKLHMLCNLMV